MSGLGVTKVLEDVFGEAQKLPEAEQEQLAAAIRAEIEAFADEALAEHRSGRSHPLDPDLL